MDIPWCTIGDFNVITSMEEKFGGIPYNMNKTFEFISVIEACGLIDLGYTGNPFTWCNQMAAQARVWKRLDRSMVNDKWLEVMPQTTVEHLPSVGSDHSPLLMEMVNGNPMWKWHQKMKNLIPTLSVWSKKEYGDIYAKVKEHEHLIKVAEEELQWFKEGDANTKYFHALMRGRRRRLLIHKICNNEGEWIQGDNNIANAACDHFQKIFTGQENRIDERILQYLPTLVTPEHNRSLQEIPSMEELRHVVFSMNPNSAPGPDGMGGKFYQVCWEIIKEDLLSAIQVFFNGQTMPKFMSHACLILLPKVDQPNIAENIMLAQEITTGIKKPKEGDNVIIKLDMTKAYDRVSWSYTCLVLRKMGFGEVFIDMVWRIMSNNCSKHSIQLIMDTLTEYEGTSDQLINKNKSHFMVPANTPQDIIQQIKEGTGFTQKDSPISYLGCPLYIGRQRIIYYSQLVDKVIRRISGCQSRLLRVGGRENDRRKYHWASWESLSLPYEEGGIGVRRLTDICTSLQCKHWWLLRTTDFLWG
ncbi:uncharacterized protein [Solanum tuberosum]|uniref:uncharacterized protein n=1 Tax=Solanum tuberosum TaxID=4113 RepID=UPI00073A4116|nr:PREDICTED: uncharacterized protein LOC107059871 [Solanum tuberosum]